MTIFVCGADDLGMGNLCAECDSWLGDGTGTVPREGQRFCDETCADQHVARTRHAARDAHLRTRDLLCECATCHEAGHPTEAERAEWAAYLREYGGVR